MRSWAGEEVEGGFHCRRYGRSPSRHVDTCPHGPTSPVPPRLWPSPLRPFPATPSWTFFDPKVLDTLREIRVPDAVRLRLSKLCAQVGG